VRSLGSDARRGPKRTERLRYRFDRSLGRGPAALVGWLGALTLAIVLLAATVIVVLGLGIHGGEAVGFPESFWQALLRVLEPTSLAEDQGWALRLVSLIVTFSGIFIASALIGLIASSLDQRILGLRKGRGLVLESGHILILGWSERLFSVVSELVEANANQRRAAIVVLADQDKTHMEDQVRHRIGPTGRTEIICRTGDPASGADLQLVNDTTARAVVVLAEDGAADASAISAALMVLHRDPDRRCLVVELRDRRTARDLNLATGGRTVTVEADDVIAKVTAQACYQAGMGGVYQELLTFSGDEVYFAPATPVVGHTFGEAMLAYDTSTVIGRVTADGVVQLAPPVDTVFEPGDQLMAISRDDDTVVFGGFPPAGPAAPEGARPARMPPSSRLLIVGWSAMGALVLRELEALDDRPSVVDVLVDDALAVAADLAPVEGWPGLRWIPSADERRQLTDLVVERGYDHVLVLGYRGRLSPAEADAHTLLTLATLRRAVPPGPGAPRVVAEVVDSRNVDIARATGADDLVVSDRLSSLLIAQLAERPIISAVFEELFDPVGASIELRPADAYTSGSEPFARVVAAASRQGEVAIGYRLADGQVVVNPPKRSVVALGHADQVIVLTRPPEPSVLAADGVQHAE
jgi:voltage-gated potassium channel Kch